MTGLVEVEGYSNAITDNCSKFILFTSTISDNLCGIFNSFLSSKTSSEPICPDAPITKILSCKRFFLQI